MQPCAQGLDRAETGAGTRLALELVDGVDQRVRVARWREHLDQRRDWHQSLWTVLMFQAWREARAV
jgi:hypothetical protein